MADVTKSVKQRKPTAIIIHYCGVIDCVNNSKYNPDLAFFSIPTMKADPERREKWLVNIGRSDILEDIYRYVVVCEKHFENKYKNYLHFSSRKQLTNDAIPTLHLPGSLDTEENNSMDVDVPSKQTAEAIINTGTNQSRTPSLRNVLKNYRNASENSEKGKIETSHLELSLLCAKYLSKPLNLLMNIHGQLNKENERSSSYTEKFKKRVVCIYLENNRVYEVLQSSLGLPPVSDLPTFIPWDQDIINEHLIKILKSRVDLMSQEQVHCTICVSLVSIQPNYDFDIQTDTVIGFDESKVYEGVVPLKYALVAMVRGIFDEWTQVAAFSLLGALKQCDFNLFCGQWLDNVIFKLFKIGLNIKVVISDINDFLINAFVAKRVSDEEPFLLVNEKKIFYMFDAYSLIGLVYNFLKKNDSILMTLDRCVKWDHILNFYKNDCARKFRLAPKLTKDHFNQCTEQQDVSQVLNLETAAGISTFVQLDLLEEGAMITAQFIMQINKILDTSINSNLLQSNYKYENIFSSSLLKRKFSANMINFFKGLKSNKTASANQTLNFVDCCVVTLENLLLLHEHLSVENNTKNVTQYLNQDPLVEFTKKARTKNGECKDPTAKELLEIIKETLFQNCKIKKHTNSNKEMEQFIEKVNELTKLEGIKIETDLQRCNCIYSDFEVFGVDSLVYVAMYLLNKAKNTGFRIKLKRTMLRSRVYYESDKVKNFTYVPNDHFVQFVEQLDQSFIINFQHAITSGKVVDQLMKQFKSIKLHKVWHGMPVTDIKRWFIVIRIFQTLKVINKQIINREKFIVTPLLQ